jgi:hypothetical protein
MVAFRSIPGRGLYSVTERPERLFGDEVLKRVLNRIAKSVQNSPDLNRVPAEIHHLFVPRDRK